MKVNTIGAKPKAAARWPLPLARLTLQRWVELYLLRLAMAYPRNCNGLPSKGLSERLPVSFSSTATHSPISSGP